MLKRKYKGMTLAEIMTAIAIAGLMALLMVQVMNCVNATMRSTTNLNKRLAYEGKVADNLQTTEADAMTTAELQNFNVRIRYDQQGGAYTKSVNVDNEPGVVRITEYTCKYDVSDYVGSEANYHFLVAAPHTYTPSVTPDGGFIVRLIIDDDVRTVDTLQKIEISGAAVNASYTYDASLTGSGFSGGFKATPIVANPGDPPSMLLPTEANVIPGSDVTTTGAYCIDIPVVYPSNLDVIANPANGRGLIQVKLTMSRTSAHDATLTKEYDFSEMLLDYCTASEYSLPDGTPSVQYYPTSRTNAQMNDDLVGATYNLHKNGSVTVVS